MKEKTKKTIIKAISVLVIILMVGIVAFYLFNLFGGKGELLKAFQTWTKENIFLACFLFLALSPIVNIIPGISSIFFITLANMMLNDQTPRGMLHAFLLADASVIITSTILFLLGKVAGKKVVGWIIGKEDYQKAEKLLTIGGKTCLPFVYLLPLFPDDTISFLAGCTNISFSYNFINVILFRSVGVFVTCFFGTNIFHYENFLWWHWVLFILGCLVLVAFVLFLVKKYYSYLKYKEEGGKYILLKGLLKENKKKSE